MISACRQGDRKAQERLFRMHYEFAMRIALRYARDEQDAAEIVSHSFYKMFRSITAFDPAKGNFPGWLKKIIINEGIDHIKRRRKLQFTEITEQVEVGFTENEFAAKTDIDNLLLAVKELPAATYTVFMLFVTDGYSHKEIAGLLSISEGTSKWHLSEARRLLKQKISTERT